MLRRLEAAYQRFFAGQGGYPKFKGRGQDAGLRFPDPKQFALDQANARAKLPKLGWLRLRQSRSVPGTLKNATVTQEHGRWFVSQRIRTITARVGGKSMEQVAEPMRAYLPGWKAYFRLAQTPATYRDLDSWTRHRLRAIQLKHWRVGRTIYSRLRALGASHELAVQIAGGAGRWWRHSEADQQTVSGVHGLPSAVIIDLIAIICRPDRVA